jgi:PIN domain nuclease of toxin-antitoxin system
MQPILLDTCAALWLVAGAPLADDATGAITAAQEAGQPVWISPITAWEIGLLARKGRFRSPLPPQRWFARLCELPGLGLCNLDADILFASSSLPGDLHDDPADRILAATAREYGFRLMTRDRTLLAYAAQGHLAAIDC